MSASKTPVWIFYLHLNIIRISCSASSSFLFLHLSCIFLHICILNYLQYFFLILPEKISHILFRIPYAHQGTYFGTSYFSSIFFSILYVALDQKNPFALKYKASRDSSIIFLSSCTTKRNSNLQQYLIKRKISCLTPNAF